MADTANTNTKSEKTTATEKKQDVKFVDHKSKADKNENIEVNREGQDVNVNGDNSRQEPISPVKRDLQDGDAGASSTSSQNLGGIPSGQKATLRQATVDEDRVQNEKKDFPAGTPKFVKEHYEEVGDPAIVLFLSLLNLNNRKTIDKEVLQAYKDFPNKDDLETNYNTLRGSTVLR